MQKIVGTLMLVAGVALIILMMIVGVKSSYHWNNDFEGYWNLADKASTISQKSEYIDKFVVALDQSGLHGTNDALFYKTQDNSFDKNFEALKSLQTRLQEIKTLDPNTFQYQTAIQQITAQEQGEAQNMLSVLHGCWEKVHYYWLWNGFLVFLWVAGIILSLGSGLTFLLADNF